LSARYCGNCGSALPEDALYCHKCGKEIQDKIQAGGPKDNFKLGLLLIRIGAALSALLPLLALAGITAFSGGVFLSSMPGMLAGILAVIFGMGALFAAITFKFHNDIARGNKERIVHTLILAIVMFFLGSNIAGIVVGIGAFLCYNSPRKMASAMQ
jgi:predicted nucleic acid-binding Zn ribbon protein